MWRTILWVGVLLMGTYLLRTPDGWEFEFDQSKFAVDPGIPDGFGLPPVQHQVQTVFHQPGQLLQDIAILPRVVTITAKLNGTCLEELHALRCKLWNALRWNRTLDDPPAPAQLVYRETCGEATLDCFYLGDATDDIGADESRQAAGIRLVAYDPMWKGEAHALALDSHSVLGVSYNVGKINGLWDAFGNNGTAISTAYNDAVYDPARNFLYVGGNFLNWAGIAAADKLAKYDFNTGTWSAMGGSGANDQIASMVLGSDGMLYLGGDFSLIGGQAISFVARYNPDTDTFSSITPGGDPDNLVRALAFDASRSRLYVGGLFTNLNGVARARIAYYNISTATWSTMGAGANNNVMAFSLAPDGSLYVGGAFTSIMGVAATRIAKYNPVTGTMSVLGAGMNDQIWAVAVAPNGDVYAGGQFTTPTNYIARWNGTAWFALGSATGMDAIVYDLKFDSAGLLYVGGAFTVAGGLALADRIAIWNGTAFSQLDIDLPGNPYVSTIALWNGNIYLLFTTAGSANVGFAITSVQTEGDARAYPIFTITGPGTLEHIDNLDSGKQIVFNATLAPGETATVDLSPGVKTFTSDVRGDLFPFATVLPLSDFATWALEPHPIALNGNNRIAIYLSGATPVELGDNNNQLSGWASITGITYLNTDAGGKLYVTIVSDGGGFYHVDLYDDAARTHLVGHTATYNSNGAKAIVADNSSGLGGTVTVDARTAADADIVVYFATAEIEWTDQFLSADCAVMCDEYLPLIGVAP